MEAAGKIGIILPGLPGRKRLYSWLFVLIFAALLQTLLAAPAALGQVGTGNPTASLRIRVTDSIAETPVERVRVQLTKFPDGVVQQAFCDSTGLVEFLGLTAQTYVVRAGKSGFLDAETQVDIRRGEFSKSISLPLQRIQTEKIGLAEGSVTARTLAIPDAALKEFLQGVKFLQEQKNPSDSALHLKRAIEISPDYFEAHFLLGMAYVQLKSARDAQGEFLKALELNPKSLSPYYPLSMLLFAEKRFDEEERLLLRAMEMDKQGWQWPFELARCYAGQGSWDKALQYGKMAHELPNAPSKTHLLMADLYSNSGDTETAAREIEEFVRLDPESPYIPRARQALAKLRQKTRD